MLRAIQKVLKRENFVRNFTSRRAVQFIEHLRNLRFAVIGFFFFLEKKAFGKIQYEVNVSECVYSATRSHRSESKIIMILVTKREKNTTGNHCK